MRLPNERVIEDDDITLKDRDVVTETMNMCRRSNSRRGFIS